MIEWYNIVHECCKESSTTFLVKSILAMKLNSIFLEDFPYSFSCIDRTFRFLHWKMVLMKKWKGKIVSITQEIGHW